jgi:hypothetical protein
VDSAGGVGEREEGGVAMTDIKDFNVAMQDEKISLSTHIDGVYVTVTLGRGEIHILTLGQLRSFPIYANKNGDFMRIEVGPRPVKENGE